MIKQIGQIERMKECAEGIDQDVKLGIFHLLPDRLSKAGAHAKDLALMRHGKRRIRNRKIDGPAHRVKLSYRHLMKKLPAKID